MARRKGIKFDRQRWRKTQTMARYINPFKGYIKTPDDKLTIFNIEDDFIKKSKFHSFLKPVNKKKEQKQIENDSEKPRSSSKYELRKTPKRARID